MSDSSQRPVPPKKLELYLDGQMTPEDAKTFEHKMQANHAMQKEVALQEKIDQSLHRLFDPPALSEGLLSLLEDRSDLPKVDFPRAQEEEKKKKTILSDLQLTKRSVRLVLLALAASIACVFVGWQFLSRSGQNDRYRRLAMAEIYEKSVQSGFHPLWVCENDRQFAETFFERNGQALVLKTLPEGTEMVGLAYLFGLGPNTTTLMARVDEQPVMVFVDRVEEETSAKKPGWFSELSLFREQRDGLVFYELTPLDQPRVMQWLYRVELDEVSAE